VPVLRSTHAAWLNAIAVVLVGVELRDGGL
jgi:hypothetical protein